MQIKAETSYRTRDGRKATPVLGRFGWFYLDSSAARYPYAANGDVLRYDPGPHPEDLVAEWSERTPQIIVAEIDALMAELKEYYR